LKIRQLRNLESQEIVS